MANIPWFLTTTAAEKQKLSYRKQIARLLRTPYAEGINSNRMTLKCRLEVTQSHWNCYHSKA